MTAFFGSVRTRTRSSAVERGERHDDRQPPDELRDQPELEQVLGHQLLEQPATVRRRHRGFGAEPDRALPHPLLDDPFEPVERAAAHEQHVRRVDLDEVLVRVLAATLRRHVRDRSLEDLQQRLLDALAGHVPGDRRVVGLAGDLVDLVDVDDPALRPRDVEVGRLDQPQQDVLDVLTDIARLRERRRVGDAEGHVQHPGEGLGEEGLARARGSDQEDVRLLELDIVDLVTRVHPLVVVVDGNR